MWSLSYAVENEPPVARYIQLPVWIGDRLHMFLERIEIDPHVMLGKAVIRGTRVPVELILRKLSEGATEADLLEGYPSLPSEDIRATLRYAAAVIAHEDLVDFEGRKSTDK